MSFVRRHLGPTPADVDEMLAVVGVDSLDALIDQTVPDDLRLEQPLTLPPAMSEAEVLVALRARADQNQIWRSYLGQGYYGTHTPPVILRNILENPSWYTAYTPYQPEISQGRLEALLLFQTLVQDLCGMEIASASLLDEATAAAEAMTMCHRLTKGRRGTRFLVSAGVHAQTLAVVQTRAAPLGFEVVVGEPESSELEGVFGVLIQHPSTDGRLVDVAAAAERVHAAGAVLAVATDLLALTVLQPPGAQGADIALGSAQRFGVPMGFGGPHAGFMATRFKHRRQMPGRIIGVSQDVDGAPALRLALQTREQHIRRQKATSNICTAQVLLAVIAAMYAVWHGPKGLVEIAERVHGRARALAGALRAAGFSVSDTFFDTVRVEVGADREQVLARAAHARINLRPLGEGSLVVAMDETVSEADLADLLAVFGVEEAPPSADVLADWRRTLPLLPFAEFEGIHSETQMMRYLHRLAAKDLALDTAMISLGSCTMKLNAAAEMAAITWPGFAALHPFVPADQAQGYHRLFGELEAWLCEITGFDAMSLQPNAGSQGEYAGLLAIRGYHLARGEARDICLIPASAHGTNPASATLAGLKVVVVACDDDGNIDVDDLRAKAEAHVDSLAALMVTYPSTHGVFEAAITEICEIVHAHGGQVYMDGANMNAMVGLCRPVDLGADVCHLNLHKTFAIPHGGGGPGMGPIGVRAHLAPHLPGHVVVDIGRAEGAVSAAPWGSPSILPISWAYIAMLGAQGLRECSRVAILNANYIAARLEGYYPVLYRGEAGRVAHECILDMRPLKQHGVEVIDIAKRLVDYGFHAPTMSFPVVGTLMVEPTESEDRAEIDRFCEAMIAIRAEVRAIASGQSDPNDNALHHAPHTVEMVTADQWDHSYPRSQAAWPAGTGGHKYWPAVRRVDDAYGDRHLVCACPPLSSYQD